MANLEKKSFENPDELKAPEKTNAAVVNFGTVAASRVVLQPGWKWSECIKPIVGTDSCQAGHVGMILQGTSQLFMMMGQKSQFQLVKPILLLQGTMVGSLEMKR